MRLNFLDTFRGITIFAMILSGSIAFNGILPDFMYHAQVPPPKHVFNGNIPGITWVDLVFPFFLFAMGLSLPISFQNKKNTAILQIVLQTVIRALRLAWFAIIIQHIKQCVVDGLNYEKSIYILISLLVLIFQYTNLLKLIAKKLISNVFNEKYVLELITFFISLLWFAFIFPKLTNTQFKFSVNPRFDIIILVLANVSLSGTLIYYFTRQNITKRLIAIAIVAAFVLNGKYGGGILQELYNTKYLSFLFNFEFHKYLLIVLPATIVGEFLLQPVLQKPFAIKENLLFALMQLLIIVFGVYMLFIRQTNNYILWLVFATIAIVFCIKYINYNYVKVVIAGLLLLWLGLLIEPLQGGIKKDSATFSYYFVTAGFACLFLHAIYLIETSIKLKFDYFSEVGKNALGAYEMGKLLVYPLMVFTSTNIIYNNMVNSAWQGFFRGLIFTTVTCLFAYLFNKKGLGFKA